MVRIFELEVKFSPFLSYILIALLFLLKHLTLGKVEKHINFGTKEKVTFK